MREPSVVYHIGQHKTGTTSLQNALFADSERLRRAGVLFPATGHALYADGRSDANHNSLHYLFYAPNHPWIPGSPTEICRSLTAEIQAAQPERIIVSAEDAFFVGDRRHRVELNAIDVLLPFDKDVVVFLRRPDRYISSWQKQLLRFPGQPDALHTEARIRQVLASCKGNYKRALTPFLDRYRSVRVFRYENGTDTTSLFYSEIVGIEPPESTRSNESVPDAFATLALEHVRESGQLTGAQIAALMESDPKVKVDLLGRANRAILVRNFEPVARWLSEEFGPECTFSPSSMLSPDEDSMSVEEAEAQFRDLFEHAIAT